MGTRPLFGRLVLTIRRVNRRILTVATLTLLLVALAPAPPARWKRRSSSPARLRLAHTWS